jgi:hypothetical protein
MRVGPANCDPERGGNAVVCDVEGSQRMKSTEDEIHQDERAPMKARKLGPGMLRAAPGCTAVCWDYSYAEPPLRLPVVAWRHARRKDRELHPYELEPLVYVKGKELPQHPQDATPSYRRDGVECTTHVYIGVSFPDDGVDWEAFASEYYERNIKPSGRVAANHP